MSILPHSPLFEPIPPAPQRVQRKGFCFCGQIATSSAIGMCDVHSSVAVEEFYDTTRIEEWGKGMDDA